MCQYMLYFAPKISLNCISEIHEKPKLQQLIDTIF